MGDMSPDTGRSTLEGSEQGFATTRVDALLGWARKYSLFAYPFVTACCGMEFMALDEPALRPRALRRRGPALLAAPEPTCSGSSARSASARRPSSGASTSR